jgi:23S rRNA pseudouridine2605 synthase
MRINKYLASCGVASRRAAEQLILDGRVRINGEIVTDLATQVNVDRDQVRLDGKEVRPGTRYRYIMLNKPKGAVVTAKDERGRKTVTDLVRTRERIFPVGRLDIDTEGLLFLTNDGGLAHRLMHPSYKISKTYRVRLNKSFQIADFEPLTQGIELEDGLTLPSEAYYYSDDPSRVEVRVTEGRYHLVRRMFEALGYEIKTLKRIQIGPISLGSLTRGHWRPLKAIEVDHLKQAVGLSERKRGSRKNWKRHS